MKMGTGEHLVSDHRSAISDAEQGASVVGVLVAARKLIEKPWHFSRSYDSESGPDGFKIGAFEAVRRAASDARPENWDNFELAIVALNEAAGQPIGHLGRNHSHAAVLAAFDKAIAAAREAESRS